MHTFVYIMNWMHVPENVQWRVRKCYIKLHMEVRMIHHLLRCTTHRIMVLLPMAW